jgi:hypothetical protein
MTMPSIPLNSSEDGPYSVRTSITDIPAEISPRHSNTSLQPEELRLLQSTPLHSCTSESLYDDLDIEDPLSRLYVNDDEFERFSKTEICFITASCVGVVAMPLLYLLVSRLKVVSMMKKLMVDVTCLFSKYGREE